MRAALEFRKVSRLSGRLGGAIGGATFAYWRNPPRLADSATVDGQRDHPRRSRKHASVESADEGPRREQMALGISRALLLAKLQ